MKAAFLCNLGAHDPDFCRVFDKSRCALLEKRLGFFPFVLTQENFAQFAHELQDVEVIFSTWGMWSLSPSQLEALPNLRAVFYAAGSVKPFASPLLTRDILIISAWAANAIPVSEWTLAQILLSNKGFWVNNRGYRGPEFRDSFRGRGNYGATVSILGAGQIGRRVLELLRPFRLQALVFDPFLSYKAAELLNAEKVELDEAFERGNVVSNHLAALPATDGLLRGAHFSSMPENATFINTGRGSTVAQDELIAVLRNRSDLTALLDVTEPEPPPITCPLWTMENVHLTSHIAGSIGDEVGRMADFVIEEFDAWRTGQLLRYAITPQMLETLA